MNICLVSCEMPQHASCNSKGIPTKHANNLYITDGQEQPILQWSLFYYTSWGSLLALMLQASESAIGFQLEPVLDHFGSQLL